MAVEIVMPRLGWTMEEGTLVEWMKKPGEAVQAGEVLFTVETDKALNEVESFDAGRLHIPADAPGPGATVAVGTVIGYLLAEGEEAPASVTPAARGPEVAAPSAAVTARSEAPGAEGASAPPQGSGAEAAPQASSEGAGRGAASKPAGAAPEVTPAARAPQEAANAPPTSEGARQGAVGAPGGPAPKVTPAGRAPQEAANAPPTSEAAAPRQTPAGSAAAPGGGTDSQEPPAPAESSSAPAISPRARRLAQQLGIDWRKVRGTGRTGRITEDDVRAAAADQTAGGGSQ